MCAEDETFIRFFRNILNRDFPRYEELVRIEPGYAMYDWLVQNYNEAQTRNTQNSTTQGRVENVTSGTTTTATDQSTTEQGNTSGSVSRSTTGSTSGETSTTHGHIVETSGEDETTYGRHRTRSGSETHAQSGGEWSNTAENSGTKELSKDNPQSQTYVSGFDIGNTFTAAGDSLNPQVNEGNSLDWQYPGSQREVSDLRQSGTKTGTDRSDTITYNSVKDTDGGKDSKETSQTVTNSGTDSGETSETRTETGSETSTGNSSRTTTTAGESSVITGQTGTQSTTGNSVDEGLSRSISTGRSIDPATLLENAVAFISATSAWEWLRSRLSVCFIGMYDV